MHFQDTGKMQNIPFPVPNCHAMHSIGTSVRRGSHMRSQHMQTELCVHWAAAKVECPPKMDYAMCQTSGHARSKHRSILLQNLVFSQVPQLPVEELNELREQH